MFSTINRKPVQTILPIAALTLIVSAGLLNAGPLNPPPGPITGTFKTLTEVEPRTAVNAVNTPGDASSVFRITQPGSYYLTGNVVGVAGKSGIEIAASGVTLDLNGFVLGGVDGSMSGVASDGAGLSGVSVRNGTVANWPGSALALISVDSARVEGLTVDNCFAGIAVGRGAKVSGCTSRGGDSGIYADAGSTVRDCVVSGSASQGIGVGGGSVVEGCTVRTLSSGIYLYGRGTVARTCTVSGGQLGIGGGSSGGDSDVVVEGCTVSGCANGGIIVGVGARVVRNSVSGSGGVGIWVKASSLVAENTVRDNQNASNSAAGILVQAGDSRVSIRGNTVVGNDKGIRVLGTNSAIYANELSVNDQAFDIAAGNRVGPIVAGAVTAAPISGSSGGNGMGSTDPTANILY